MTKIEFGNNITLQRLNAPYRGNAFFDGPILVIRCEEETYAAEKLDKLVRITERKAEFNGLLWKAANAVAQTLVEEASRASRFWTGEGFSTELRNRIRREIAAAIIEHQKEN